MAKNTNLLEPSAAQAHPSFGPCPICSRDMLDDGASTDKHHMVPKSRGGVATTRIHRVCHSFIHSHWTVKELEAEFCDPDASWPSRPRKPSSLGSPRSRPSSSTAPSERLARDPREADMDEAAFDQTGYATSMDKAQLDILSEAQGF